MNTLLDLAGRRGRPLAATILLLLALVVVIKPAVAGPEHRATVLGSVFDDRDRDGQRDPGEEGIGGVSVSDGAGVTRTDSAGNYRLAVDLERRLTDLVWVTTPSGWRVPTDEAKTPQFYRRLDGLAPGGEGRRDFGLLRDSESEREDFNFAAMADVHVRPDPTFTNNSARFGSQVAQVNELTGNPAFVLIAGDMLIDATEPEFQEYKRATAASRLPVYAAVGNHDITFRNTGGIYRNEIENFRRHLGPEWYSFDYGQRHFVMLEDWRGFTASGPREEQLEWLRQDLAQNAGRREVVVVTHVQLNAPDTRVSADGGVDTNEFVDLLEQYNVKLALMGHTHVNDVTERVIGGAENVNTSSSGSNTNDMTPPGYRQVQFKDGDVTYPFKVFDVPRRLIVTNPAPGASIPREHDGVQVNAYNTSSKVTDVEYRVDGGEWRKLKQTSAFTWATTKWEAGAASLGDHRLEVRATDDAQETWSKSSSFRLVDAPHPAPQGGAAWPQFHGNALHTGRAVDALGPNLRLAWSARTSGSIVTSSPAIKDGRVYVGIRDEDGLDDNSVLAVDLRNGQPRWRFRTDAQVQTSPAVEDDIVYAASVRGNFYGIDADTGRLLWKKATGVEDDWGVQDGVQRGRMYFPPAVADGIAYQGYSTRDGSRLMAVEGRTGRLVWDVPLENDQFIAATPIVQDGRLYVVAGSRYLHALDAQTGRQLWRKRPTLTNWSHSVPAYEDGRIFVGFRTGILDAVDAATGDTLWTYQSPETSSPASTVRYINEQITTSGPAVANGTVYMGFPSGKVSAFRAATGDLLWSFQTKGGIMSSPALSGDTLYVGSNDGTIYALDPATGQQKWGFEIGTWIASSPAVSGNALVVGAFDGNLYGFTSAPGPVASTPASSFSAPASSFPAPAPTARDSRRPRVSVAGIRRRCASRDFALRVRARDASPLERVTVSLNGRRLRSSNRGRYTVRIPARRLAAGRHRIVVAALDAFGNRARRAVRFRRCGRGARAPRFTG